MVCYFQNIMNPLRVADTSLPEETGVNNVSCPVHPNPEDAGAKARLPTEQDLTCICHDPKHAVVPDESPVPSPAQKMGCEGTCKVYFYHVPRAFSPFIAAISTTLFDVNFRKFESQYHARRPLTCRDPRADARASTSV